MVLEIEGVVGGGGIVPGLEGSAKMGRKRQNGKEVPRMGVAEPERRFTHSVEAVNQSS